MEGGYGDNQFPSTNHHIMTEISMAKILIPSPHPSPLERLCRNQREPTSASTRNRRSGDEALDLPARSLLALKLQRRQAASAKAGRKPFIAQRWGAKPMKRNPFPTRPITHNFKRPHSKAEEPDPATAGFRWNPLSIMITTQSLRGRGGWGVI